MKSFIKNMKKFILLLLCLVFLYKEKAKAITFNSKDDVVDFLVSQKIYSVVDLINITTYATDYRNYPFDLDDCLKNKIITTKIESFTSVLANNFGLLGKSYSITNGHLIDYVDIIKNPKKDYGFNIRVLNFDTFVSSELINRVASFLTKDIKENKEEKEEAGEIIVMQKLQSLASTIPTLNTSILTLKYDHPLQDDLKLGVMLDINMDFNILLIHLSPVLNFNYSIGSWVDYNLKDLSIEFKDFDITNNLKSGLFFTKKFYEFDILVTNIAYNIESEDSTKPKLNLTSQNEFYDAYNTMLFAEWNFNMNFNDDSIYSWFINNINVINTVKLTNYSFNFKNPYFDGSIHEKLGYLGKHNYTIIDNNFRLVFDKTINFGKYFSIAIPFGFNLNSNFYGSHKNMFKDIIGESFVDIDKAFEPFIGLNLGIFGKSLNFEYNRNGYRLRFISRF